MAEDFILNDEAKLLDIFERWHNGDITAKGELYKDFPSFLRYVKACAYKGGLTNYFNNETAVSKVFLDIEEKFLNYRKEKGPIKQYIKYLIGYAIKDSYQEIVPKENLKSFDTVIDNNADRKHLNPLDELLLDEEKNTVRKAIRNSLSSGTQMKKIAKEKYIDGKGMREIADEMDLKLNNAYTQLDKANKYLQMELYEYAGRERPASPKLRKYLMRKDENIKARCQ